MNFKRKIYDKLLSWKNEQRRIDALLIEGARRVGKTTIVKEFAKNEYNDYLFLISVLNQKMLKTYLKI